MLPAACISCLIVHNRLVQPSGHLLLGVNIDHVATIRQARGSRYPEPAHAACEAELGGADGVTIHLREDRRHIQERDTHLLQQMVQSKLNFECAPTAFMAEHLLQLRPADCCLVPERREELTTEGGLDVLSSTSLLEPFCRQLMAADIRVAVFVDPEEKQIEAAAQIGIQVVELHTGAYANAAGEEQVRELERLHRVAEYAASLGLQVHAGHGLHYHNVMPVAELAVFRELNIGHAIVSRALFVGLRAAVAEMKQLLILARKKI